MTVSVEYLAGIIDGEGSIMFVRTGNAKLNGMWTSWTVKLIVANTNMRLLTALQEEFGGKIWMVNREAGNWKVGYRLQWFGAEAVELIKRFAPHLIIKREQAGLAIQALSFRDNLGGRGRQKCEVAILALNECAEHMRALNKRGVN